MSDKPRVVLIGDSIRLYYEPTVRRLLEDVADVSSSERNGGDSRNVLANVDAWAPSGTRVLHLNCGLHDLKKALDASEPNVPIDEYERNVRQLLTRAKERAARVIWATITPVNGERHHATKGFDRWEADVQAYNAVASRVAKEAGVEINDLNALVESRGKNDLLKFDGVHFTDEASRVLGEAVAAVIRRAL
jgi:lysophospholipase L1-like esterase